MKNILFTKLAAGVLLFPGIVATPLGAQTLAEALDTPGRVWESGHTGSGGVEAVALPEKADDGVDSVILKPGVAGETGWIQTVVRLPCLLTFRGKATEVSDGAGRMLSRIVPSFTNDFQSKEVDISGSGPCLIRFSTWNGEEAVVDQVVFRESIDRLEQSVNLGTPGLRWTQYSAQPFETVRNPATGEISYRGGDPLWLETTVNGPCYLGGGQAMTLPDHGNRQVFNGMIHYAGPQRVLLHREPGLNIDKSQSAYRYLTKDNYRTLTALGEATGAPELTWTTGGDVPWAATGSSAVISGPLWAGEQSWIETEVNGPGILSWRTAVNGAQQALLSPVVTCDGLEVAGGPAAVYLHLAPGPHHLRWTAAMPANGSRNSEASLELRSVRFTAQPAESVSEILSGGSLSFTETYTGTGAPVPWPDPNGWRILDDPELGVKVLRADSHAGALRLLAASPARMVSRLKMTLNAAEAAEGSGTPPQQDAPFSWQPWATDVRPWPQRAGFFTFASAVTLAAQNPVSLEEALDNAALTWTTGGSRPGLWKALSGAESGVSDPDALYLADAGPGDLAWLETTVTGPLNVITTLAITGGAEPGIRLLLDQVPVAVDSKITSSTGLRIPPGPHKLRWEAAPLSRIHPLMIVALRSISTSTPGTALPDVGALIEAPDLEWGALGVNLSAVSTGSHDGVDALQLGTPGSPTNGGYFTTAMTGPGLLSFWMKGASAGTAPQLDDLDSLLPVVSGPPTVWNQYTLPIPSGRHSLRFTGSTTTVLDEFSWQPLPSIAPQTAANSLLGLSFVAPEPDRFGAAAYGAFADDGVDALMLMPGASRRLELHLPGPATLTMRVRSVFGAGTFTLQDLSATATSTAWSPRSFSTAASAGTNTVYLKASTVPVMIDKITVTPLPADNTYFPWATARGLPEEQAQPSADPDGDGLPNLLEYTFGLDPGLRDANQSGTDLVPGLPVTGTYTDPATGKIYAEVRYWCRQGQTAAVETAGDPSGTARMGMAGGWNSGGAALQITNGPSGLSHMVWRSSVPIEAGVPLFVRVRASIP